jgi:hypothetical protein
MRIFLEKAHDRICPPPPLRNLLAALVSGAKTNTFPLGMGLKNSFGIILIGKD